MPKNRPTAGWVGQRHSQPAPSKAPTKPAQARPPACGPGPVLPPPPPTRPPPRPAEQANGTTADSESRRSPRERSRYKYRPVTDQFNFSEPGPNVAVHRAAHTVEAGFTRPSKRTTWKLRRYSMRRVGVRLLADRSEVVNVCLCRQPADDVPSEGASVRARSASRLRVPKRAS